MSDEGVDLGDVDGAVTAAVKAGKNRLNLIAAFAILEERIVDRALQRLRRRGVLVFMAGEGWKVAAADGAEAGRG